MTIILNGGIRTLAEIEAELPGVDGIMIGREAYSNPYVLSDIHHKYHKEASEPMTRHAIIMQFLGYVEQQLATGKVTLSRMTRPLLGLFQGQPGARKWRRYLSEHAHLDHSGVETIKEALHYV